MLFFVITRSVFILYNLKKTAEAGIQDALLSYWHALYLDNSIVCYILVFPFLLLFVQTLAKASVLNRINQYYTFLLIFVIAVITVGELAVYEEWNVKLTYKALSYLENPGEVLHSARPKILVFGTLLIGVITFIGIFAFQKLIFLRFYLQKRNYFISVVFFLITPVLLFLGIRGGTRQIPISESSVYFSKNNFINNATVNTTWNLVSSIVKNMRYMNENPYKFYDYKEAKRVVDSLYAVNKDTTVKILNIPKPNIVMVVLESWSGDLVKSLGGLEGVTPEFEKLIANGLLFTNFYASGELSDQGLGALLSGFPAQPTTSIVKQPDKFQFLPSLPKRLQKEGYYTSFHFGGQLNYGNIRGFIFFHNMDKIMEGADFPSSIPQGSLGVHDQYLFAQLLKDYNKYRQPFFATSFTLSSHSPYDEPMEDVIKWGDEHKPFLNSVYYADKCIGDFMREAKTQTWYKNTLFIFVADHTHLTPKNRSYFSRDYRHIPLLLYGPALKEEYRGKKDTTICSQTDVSATLLAQLGLPHKEFHWSKDVFNPYSHEFAYYSSKLGFGWTSPGNYFAYDYDHQEIEEPQFDSKASEGKLVKCGKCFLQVLFEEYLKY